jgi:hypothetical protein
MKKVNAMLDATTQSRLQELLRRESRSFLLYISDSFPWATAGEKDALTQLQSLVDEERKATAALAKFLTRQRIPLPYLGSYPVAFTTLNFVSLDHLLPMLIDSERQALGVLEEDLAGFTDAACRQEVQKLLDMKQQHLKILEALAAAHPETVLR